jgi:hypothetical protein
MKTNSIPLLLLKIYAIIWILVGGLGIFIVLPNLLRGKFEIPFMVLALPVGIGLFRQSRSARRDALIFLFVFLAFDIFLFLLAGNSGNFSELAMFIVGVGGSEIKVPNPVFYSLSFGLLVGQIWFLMSKQITQYFLPKDGASS